jgi:hypothetical protein
MIAWLGQSDGCAVSEIHMLKRPNQMFGIGGKKPQAQFEYQTALIKPGLFEDTDKAVNKKTKELTKKGWELHQLGNGDYARSGQVLVTFRRPK